MMEAVRIIENEAALANEGAASVGHQDVVPVLTHESPVWLQRPLTVAERITSLMYSDPQRVWTATEIHDQLPDTRRKTTDNALARLLERGVLKRHGRGKYGLARIESGTDDLAARDGDTSRREPGDDVTRRVLQVVAADDRAWRSPDVAQAVSADPDEVSSALAELVGLGQLTEDGAGGYRRRGTNGVVRSIAR